MHGLQNIVAERRLRFTSIESKAKKEKDLEKFKEALLSDQIGLEYL